MAKRLLSLLVVITLLGGFVLFGGGLQAEAEELVFATVVKSVAFNWFIRMEEGVLQFGKDYGVKAFMEGPSVADSAQQFPIIEDLIPQGVDLIIKFPKELKNMNQCRKKLWMRES